MNETQQPMLWKDPKFMAGFIMVVLSIILGFWGKAIFIAKFYEPVAFMTGISIYVFSWVLLFAGVFLVGWETVKMMHRRIHHEVKSTVKKTYHHAKGLPRKGYDHAKNLHRKGYNHAKNLHRKSMDSLSTASKTIAEKIRQK